MDELKKETGKWWLWIVLLLVVTTVIFTGLRYLGVIGERIVFENSYQYHEARKTEMLTFRAQLTEIENLLLSTSLEKQTRINLESQAAALRMRIRVVREQ